MAGFVYLNGDFVPEDKAYVSVFDHGFLYGDGVFETMRAYGGNVFMLNEHLDRLFRSAETISLAIPATKGELGDAVRQTVKKNNLAGAYIRLSVSRGPGPIGLDPRNCPRPTIVCMARELPGNLEELRRQGVRAVIARTRRIPPEALDPSAKTFNFLNCIVAKLEANKAGAMEGIMLNTRGEVAEGTVSNVFMVTRGALVTPSPGAGILRGITRDVVLSLSAARGVEIKECNFGPDHLFVAEEVFLTNSSWEIMPVVELDGQALGSGAPGPLTINLAREYSRYVAKELL